MTKNSAKRTRVERNDYDEPFSQVSSLDEYKIKDMSDADVYYVSDFISSEIAEGWYTDLLGLDSWYQPKLKMYGREMLQSRKIAAYSTDPELVLKYSGQVVDMKYTYPPVLRKIQDQVEERLGVNASGSLVVMQGDTQRYWKHEIPKEPKIKEGRISLTFRQLLK